MALTEEKARISFRADAKLKEEAIKVLSEMQLDLSTALNLFLDQVVKQNRLPFEITNETAEERELREIRRKVEHGIKESHAGEGIDAQEYFEGLQKEKENLCS